MSTPPNPPSLTGGDDVEIRVMLARFEAKLDVALAQHGAKLEQHGQEIGELRQRVGRIEDRPIASPEGILDHETRLRAIEARPIITPRSLTVAIASTVAILGGAVTFLDRLYS